MLSKENIKNPYAVPQGYFEEFAGKLLARIKAGQSGDPREELSVLSPLLDRIDKKSPFQAPPDYFDNLTGNVLSGVRAIDFVNDELENVSPLMTGLRDKTVYQAPEGYFDDLSDRILAKLRLPAGQAPVISISAQAAVIAKASIIPKGAPNSASGARRFSASKWFRYPAAAIAIGLILTMGWLGLHKPATPAGGNELLAANLSKVSDQEILNYLENQNIPLAETMNNSTAAAVEFNDADVKNMLGNVPDEELNQYLEDNGGTKDPVTN
jgi:hypothetical protein